VSERVVLISRFKETRDARMLEDLWDDHKLEVMRPCDDTWAQLGRAPPRAVVIGGDRLEESSAWYRAARDACPDRFVVVATDDIIAALAELLYAGHDRKLGFLMRPYDAGMLKDILAVEDDLAPSPGRVKREPSVEEEIAARALGVHRSASSFVGGVCERVGDSLEVRARVEDAHRALRATLLVDLQRDHARLEAELPPGRPIANLVPERGLRRILKFALDDLVIGDEAVDDAYLIRAEVEDTAALRELAAPLLSLASARPNIEIGEERLDVLAHDASEATARAAWTLWSILVDRRRGRR
jgi:hypothetical protein